MDLKITVQGRKQNKVEANQASGIYSQTQRNLWGTQVFPGRHFWNHRNWPLCSITTAWSRIKNTYEYVPQLLACMWTCKRLHGFLFFFSFICFTLTPTVILQAKTGKPKVFLFLWFGTEKAAEYHWEVKSQSPPTPPTSHSKLHFVQMTIWPLSHSVF